MFDSVGGLSPETAARWTTLVEECRPVLAHQGMEAVQALLVERAIEILPAIAITKALLGWEETSLPTARDIVVQSTARQA